MRSNSGSDYFKQLDGFRFVSVTSVMIFHFVHLRLVQSIPLGYGVLFFFVLSSFLITRILLVAKQNNEALGQGHFFSLRQFYLRRALRIFPIYYLMVAFLLIINWKPSRDIMVYLLTYTINYKIGSGYDVGNMGHLWSLAVEEQFYILFPFLIFFVPTRYLFGLLASITVLGVAARAALYLYESDNIYFSNFNFLSALDSLGMGGMLAYLSLYRRAEVIKVVSNRMVFAAMALAFLVAMLTTYSFNTGTERFTFGNMVVLRFLFNALSFWILGWAVLIGYTGWLKLFLENSVVTYLGRISYGLYLYHFFIPGFLGVALAYLKIDALKGDGTSMIIVRACLYAMVTVAVASVSWFLIEKPCNNLKRYVEYTRATDPTATSKPISAS